jgi:hypothetical protein
VYRQSFLPAPLQSEQRFNLLAVFLVLTTAMALAHEKKRTNKDTDNFLSR